MRERFNLGPNVTVPESGRVLPVMTSIMVVLPAPFGPMMQRSSPGSICSVSSLSALKPSKLTVRFSRYENFAGSAHSSDGSGLIGWNLELLHCFLAFRLCMIEGR